VKAAEPQFTVLIRFGVDGVKDTGWSGSIAPQPAAIRAWQFDDRDALEGASWKTATRDQTYWDTPYEPRMGPTARRAKVTEKGVVVSFDSATPVRVRTEQGEFSFEPGDALWKAPRRFLDGRVEVRAAPVAQRLDSAVAVEDYPSLALASDGSLWLAYQSWTTAGDRIFVRHRRDGVWSGEYAVTASPADRFRTAIAEDGDGKVWVVWWEQSDGNFDLYGASTSLKEPRSWSRPQRLTSAPGSDIYHSLATDAAGTLHLAWQSARSGNFNIYSRSYDGRNWGAEQKISDSTPNDWEPVVATAPDGRVTLLWDTYAKGNYDIAARAMRGGAPVRRAGRVKATGRSGRILARQEWEPIEWIASSGAFEARASAQYDRQGRLWIAWEEGDWLWVRTTAISSPRAGAASCRSARRASACSPTAG
jgi:hypothetical protein